MLQAQTLNLMKKYLIIIFLSTTSIALAQIDNEEMPPKIPIATTSTLDPTVYTIVEVPPSFPDGPKALKKFISEKVTRINPKLSGTIYIRMVVNIDGQLTNMEVVKGIPNCANCENEAMKIISTMPKWKPAEFEGKKVKAYYSLPISFDN